MKIYLTLYDNIVIILDPTTLFNPYKMHHPSSIYVKTTSIQFQTCPWQHFAFCRQVTSILLRYMISLHRSAPKTLWHLIGAEGGWLSHLHQSQYWMESHLMGYGPDKSGHDWKPAWTLWLDQGGDTLKSWIRKAKAHAILEHSKQVEWKEFHFVFLNACLDAGWQHEFPWPQAEDFQNKEQVDACLACGLVFKNKAAWSVHAFRIHGRCNPCRRVMGSTRCDACSKEYRSTSRLLAHLRYSREVLSEVGWSREDLWGNPARHWQ